MKIAIVGYGPSALFAGWAALQFRDTKIDFLSPTFRQERTNAGVFYLHDSLGLPLRRATVDISGFGGCADDYSQKVYGRAGIPNSFPDARRTQEVFDAQQACALVRDIVETSGCRRIERAVKWHDFEVLAISYDLVINTAPLYALGNHTFLLEEPYSRPAWVKVSQAPPDESYVLYSAHPEVHWYRCSAVFGRFAMETVRPPVEGAPSAKLWNRVLKIEQNFDAAKELPANVKCVGRFGSWTKSALSNDAFDDAYAAIAGMR